MSDELGSDMKGLLNTMEKMDRVVKSITASFKDFSTSMKGAKNSGDFGVGGIGQLKLGSSGSNFLTGSLGNVPNMLAGNRSMNMWGSVASNGLKIAGSLVGGMFSGMPDVTSTMTRSTDYYGAGIMQGQRGVGRNQIANATFSAMRGGISGTGTDAQTASIFTQMGVSFSGNKNSQYMNLATSTANAAKYLNMGNVQAATALGGLTQGNTSQSLMRNFGIFTTDPTTGRRLQPTEIFSAINQRLTGGKKLSAKQLQTSMQGGALAVDLQNSGLSSDQQQMAYQYMLDKANGKNMDLGDKKVMANLIKESGGNPAQASMDIISSQTKTMQTASQAYIDGMQKAAKVIDGFNTAMQGFLKSPMGNAMAQLNSGVNAAAGDNATSGMFAGGMGALGGVGNIGGMMLQNHLLGRTMQQVTGNKGRAGAKGVVKPGSVNSKGRPTRATKLPKGYKWTKSGRVYNESAGRLASSAETSAIGSKLGFGASMMKVGGGAMAGGFAGDLVGGGVQALTGNQDAGFWAGLGTSVAVGEAVGGVETFGIAGLVSGAGYALTHLGQAGQAFGDLGKSIGSFFGGSGGGQSKSQTQGRTTDTKGGLKLIHPVGRAKVTTKYGQVDKIHVTPHYAIDWGVGTGTPVQAAADGTVKATGGSATNTMGTSDHSYGLYVEIDHGGGYSTWYGHLSSIGVSPGTQVKQGQTVALSGNTGYSTGPHLHFELRKGGNKIDPSSALGTNYAAAGGGYDPVLESGNGDGATNSVGSAGDPSLLGFSTSAQTIAGIPIPPSYSGAGSTGTVSSGKTSSSNLGHGGSTTSTGGSVGSGAGGDAPRSSGGKGGSMVNITLNIAQASEAEARKFAKLIKGYLEEDRLVSNMGVL